MRLLAAIRLSIETDATTSPERQRKDIEAYAAKHGHTVTGWPTDLSVSGSVPPHQRPQLGPWLSRPDEWDALIVAKLDRLSRSLLDFMTLQAELAAQGKEIICLEPVLDFSTPQGKAFAHILMAFAELERETIRARVKNTYEHIRGNGGYNGGSVPFGYRPVRRGKGWGYEPDPDYAPVAREMAQRVLGGQSMRQVAIWLNETGVPSSRTIQRIRRNERLAAEGKPPKPVPAVTWTTQQVRHILLSAAMAGLHATTTGAALKDQNLMPVGRCEGIIDRATWEQVKAAIAGGGPAHSAPRADANPLLQVAFCGAGDCGAPLYITGSAAMESVSPKYRYYRCRDFRTCRSRSIQAGLLEEAAEELFLAITGDTEVIQRVLIPAEDHTAELADLEKAAAELSAEFAALRLRASAYSRATEALHARREHLKSLPQREAGYADVPAGETFAQRWEAADVTGRRRLMHEAGFRVLAQRLPTGSVAVMALAGKDLAERAGKAAGGVSQEPVPFPGLAGDLAYPLRLTLYGPPGQRRPEGMPDWEDAPWRTVDIGDLPGLAPST
jgi:DNA invertase Pin-like site-specific DNA recombinase